MMTTDEARLLWAIVRQRGGSITLPSSALEEFGLGRSFLTQRIDPATKSVTIEAMHYPEEIGHVLPSARD